MIDVFNNEYISEDICDKIKHEYGSKLVLQERDIRRQHVFHEKNEDSWIFKYIDKFIKTNIGKSYSLLKRVTVLKYSIGDFFDKHTDGIWNTELTDNLPMHFYGGVELSDRHEFKGGEFFIKSKNVEFEKGRLFTHGYSDSHGVSKVTEGVRWSLPFLIEQNTGSKII